MKPSVKKEIKRIIKEQRLNCSVEEFQDRVDWDWISEYQKLSEDFIREFKDKVNWYWLSKYQKHIPKETLEAIKNGTEEKETTFADIHKRIKLAIEKYG